ncbi:hypothetical protein QBC46DRAFT_19603 [Diplogelasinospora grovesii]|uniref:Chromo domain-containing protein n=1 Tax=Diplogelasinospora grovesii TaxID=303347 RepID=A0AAN6N0W7_9PEZI|nr:hypothetical protein QBC46DRAFT_19603 [Diplogelasinospora grovesii]
MATVCLDQQIFYTAPAAADSKRTIRGLLASKPPSSAVSGTTLHPPPPPLPQDAGDPWSSDIKMSQNDVIEISSDDESDNDTLDDSHFDKTLESGSVAGTVGNTVGAVPGTGGSRQATKPSPAGPALFDDESTSNHEQQRLGLGWSPEPSSVSTAPHAEQGQSVPASRRELDCAGSSCRQGLGCPRHPNLSTKIYRQYRHAEEPRVDADNALRLPYTVPGGSSDTSEAEQRGCSVPQRAACSGETGDGEDCLPLARSGSGEGTLRCDEADASDLAVVESTPQPPDDRNLNTNVEEDHRPAHPPVLDRGEQADGNDERELSNAEPSMHPSTSQDRGNRQSSSGRRRRCDTNDEEDCSSIAGGDAEQAKHDDLVRPQRRKRRRVGTSAPTTRRTAPRRQARLRCTSSQSQQAQRQTQDPKRRQNQRIIPEPRSSERIASEEESVKVPFAYFEEWPVQGVVKHLVVGKKETLQAEFWWSASVHHGQKQGTPEHPRRKSPAERTSSTGRAHPSRVAYTAKEVQEGKYFQVEEILGSRRRGRRVEYLVKWEGYGHEHDSWEPVAHFEKCPEMLQQFHEDGKVRVGEMADQRRIQFLSVFLPGSSVRSDNSLSSGRTCTVSWSAIEPWRRRCPR